MHGWRKDLLKSNADPHPFVQRLYERQGHARSCGRDPEGCKHLKPALSGRQIFRSVSREHCPVCHSAFLRQRIRKVRAAARAFTAFIFRVPCSSLRSRGRPCFPYENAQKILCTKNLPVLGSVSLARDDVGIPRRISFPMLVWRNKPPYTAGQQWRSNVIEYENLRRLASIARQSRRASLRLLAIFEYAHVDRRALITGNVVRA